MKRKDGVVVPDNYEAYEQLQRYRNLEARVKLLEDLVDKMAKLLDDK